MGADGDSAKFELTTVIVSFEPEEVGWLSAESILPTNGL